MEARALATRKKKKAGERARARDWRGPPSPTADLPVISPRIIIHYIIALVLLGCLPPL